VKVLFGQFGWFVFGGIAGDGLEGLREGVYVLALCGMSGLEMMLSCPCFRGTWVELCGFAFSHFSPEPHPTDSVIISPFPSLTGVIGWWEGPLLDDGGKALSWNADLAFRFLTRRLGGARFDLLWFGSVWCAFWLGSTVRCASGAW
jgi:hypothetical protein